MNISRALRYTAAASLAAFLAACAGTGPQVAGNWQEIGTTATGNIKSTLDKSSIKRNC